jgi:endonuclease YncB( thermonuclease family)
MALDLKGKTIHVRLAGVDAPEVRKILFMDPAWSDGQDCWHPLRQLAHFGKPAQPYSREALEWCERDPILSKWSSSAEAVTPTA